MAYAFGAPSIVQDGLVFYVDAANGDSYVSGSSDTFNLINPSITGSLKNDTSFAASNAGIWDFDGTDDNINFGNSSVFTFTPNITLSTWIKSDGDWNQSFPFFLSKGTNVSYMLFGNRQSSTTLKARLRIGINGDANKVDSINTIGTNTWHCLTGTFDGSTLKIYINGSLDNSKSLSQAIPSGTDDFKINHNFNGQMGPTMIYNHTLSAQEVLQNYNALKGRFI